MMEKFKTLNNRVARDIIMYTCKGCYRVVFMMLYNYRDAFTSDNYYRLCTIVSEIAPNISDVYDTLPLIVQQYFKNLKNVANS